MYFEKKVKRRKTAIIANQKSDGHGMVGSGKGENSHDDKEIRFRKPDREDGAKIWQLIRDTGVLDLNSPYSYLMLCEYFPDTCVVAEHKNKIVGFVSAFLPPKDREVIFIWQIAVDRSQQGRGLGTKLLKVLLQRDACKNVRFLEATISPINVPSQSLFKKLARDMGTNCEISEGFPPELFPDGKHEPEMKYRIGPF